MAITSTVNIDGVTGIINCSILLNGITNIDVITYTNSSLQFSFPSKSAVTITASEFLQLLDIYNVFHIAVIRSVFSPEPQFAPFSEISITESNDGINQLAWTYTANSRKVFNFSTTYPNGSTIIQARSLANSLSFAQWQYFIFLINRYREILRKNCSI